MSTESTKYKILLVEDDPMMRMIMEEYLKEAGHIVEYAENGEEGIEKSLAWLPDLIITDLMMGGLSGIELVKQLRLDLNVTTPIFMVTSNGEEDVVMLAFELGVNDFIKKPFKKEDVLAKVQQLKNNRWLRNKESNI